MEAKFLEPPRSISDQIYEHLKQKILSGDIAPGERLMQVPVSEAFKTSRTPIRDAFHRLGQDGLVERLPQGGVRVIPLEMTKIKEIFGIRSVLEAYAVELACDRITGEEIAALKQILRQAQEVLRLPKSKRELQITRLFELTTRFHEAIYQAANNSYLMRVISNLRDIVRRMRYVGLSVEETWPQVWDEHARLIHFLEKRDKEGAVRLIKAHLINAASYVNAMLGQARQPAGRER
jgi:DNA-binding GntR family transcriptional regulator